MSMMCIQQAVRLCLAGMLFLLFLTSCEVEGGVPPSSSTDDSSQLHTEIVPEPTHIPFDATRFRIGMLDEPGDLLPYHNEPADEHITAPVSELLFPSPMLAFNYTYTTTGVLQRLPSFENGDIELHTVDTTVPEETYVDASGNITTTVTDIITTVQKTTQISQVVVTYRWNENLHWSDGTPVQADDSVFAFELAQEGVLGAAASHRQTFIERYERVDEHTNRAFLKTDFVIPPTLPPDFTDHSYILFCWTPLPKHILQPTITAANELTPTLATTDFAWAPVGYGPYMVDRRDAGSIILKRNPHYQGTLPQADVVSFASLHNFELLRTSMLNNQVDIVVADSIAPKQYPLVSRDEESGLYNVYYTPGPVWEHIDFNLDVPVFQDIRVRRAIIYGTNRQAMIDALFGGHASILHSWVVSEHWAAAPPDVITRYPYDPDHARRLLNEAGLADTNGDGLVEQPDSTDPLTIALVTTKNTPLRSHIVELFQKDMTAIGLRVESREQPIQEIYKPDGPLYRRTFELAEFAWVASPDPGGLALWSCRSIPNEENGWQGNNFSGWCFREADQAIRQAATSVTYTERLEAYALQQKLFTQEVPSLPLFQRLIVTLNNPHVHGLAPDPLAPITWNISTWAWKE